VPVGPASPIALLEVARRLADARDEREIVDIIVGRVAEAIGAASAVAYLLEGPERLVLSGLRGGVDTPPQEIAASLALPLPTCARTGEPLFFDDHEALSASFPLIGAVAALPEGRRQALVCIPLRCGADGIGAVAFGFDRNRHFGPEERAFYLTIKNHAAVAIERSRLRAAERAAHARLETVARVARRFSSAVPEVGTVAQIVAEEISLALRATCVVSLVSAQGDLLDLTAAHDPDPARLARIRAVLEQKPVRLDERSLPARVFQTGEPVIRRHLDMAAFLDATQHPEYRDHLESFPLRDLVVLPLRAAGEMLGVLALASGVSDPPLAPGDEELLGELVDRAAMAIQNSKLHEQARRAIQQREELMAVVSHDLRNPLTTVRLAAAALAAQVGGEGKPARLLSSIDRSVDHMQRLIAMLMDLATIDAGKLELRLEPVDVRSLLGEALAAHEPLAARQQVHVELQIAEGVGAVLCSRGRMHQVLANLLGNAIKFTAAGGRITLGASPSDAEVVLVVRDTGRGMAPEDLPHIFDRYWQARHSEGKGIGLGLTIAHEIVTAHGGRIWVESEAGVGTTFFIALARPGAGAAGRPVR
jgi:signal transduction histidine kinase